MKNKNAKFFAGCLLTLLMTTALLSAQESQPVVNEEERVQIGSRSLSLENQSLMLQQRQDEQKKESLAKADHETTQVSSMAYYSPYACHIVNTVAAYGDSLELEDGSWWKVASGDTQIAASWGAFDPYTRMGKPEVLIYPNTSWFSSYTYKIVNKNGTSIKANLSVGPIAFGEFTHWITGIDYYSGAVYLENGSRWNISGTDGFVFNNWQVNDTIIVGVNDSWFSSYDFILINVNMNNYLKAKQY